MNLLHLIGREHALFSSDLAALEERLSAEIGSSRFLVIGGAGSIGQAVVRELFARGPRVLHVVDISENNLVELVRDIRSSAGYIAGEFRTFALDCGGREFEALLDSSEGYDYVLNLSAMKHVRSEEDVFTLMRMIEVNIFNTIKSIQLAVKAGAKKYFCVSTDKAANPVNMMGASKRIMEMYLMLESEQIPISTARFANVAFSDGSLLHGFNRRFEKQQPFSSPNDVRRYFLTPDESGLLCTLSCIFGTNRDIYFPKLSEELHLISFDQIAIRYLEQRGFEPFLCESEDEARERCKELIANQKWPCYFFASDTTGEKDFEEFFTNTEEVDLAQYDSIGIVRNSVSADRDSLEAFDSAIKEIRNSKKWNKQDVVKLFNQLIPEFHHLETGKYLDSKM